MTIHIEIPEPLAAKVALAAKTQGKSPEELVLETVSKRLELFSQLDERLAPVYERMKALGITEDQAVEDFEAEKHARRCEEAAAEK